MADLRETTRPTRQDQPRARLLLVEDNETLAFGLRRTLESEGYAVAVAAAGAEGLARVRQRPPDLVILDLMLPPGLDGYGVLQTLRDEGYAMPVLVLTARSQEADKVYGFRLGADDYVTKPFGLSELVARVGALLRRARRVRGDDDEASPTMGEYAFGDVVVNSAARTVTRGGAPVALTPKEFDLLLALVRRPGHVISRATLLGAVWGHHASVLTRTVDIHVAELRRKLEDSATSPRHIVTVWKAGYRFDP